MGEKHVTYYSKRDDPLPFSPPSSASSLTRHSSPVLVTAILVLSRRPTPQLPPMSSSKAASARPFTVLFFASAASATSVNSLSLPPSDVTPSTLEALSKLLVERYPRLRPVLETSNWAVNEEMVDDEAVATLTLVPGDTVAVLPPVSGG